MAIIVAGLHLGVPLCQPHNCHQRGAAVDEYGIHGLSYRKSQGCISHHSSLNDLLHRSLLAAGLPSCLKPKDCVLPMARGRMGLPWCHGSVERLWHGMSLVQILLPHPMFILPIERQVLLQWKRNTAEDATVQGSVNHMPLHGSQLLWKQQALSAQEREVSLKELVDGFA